MAPTNPPKRTESTSVSERSALGSDACPRNTCRPHIRHRAIKSTQLTSTSARARAMHTQRRGGSTLGLIGPAGRATHPAPSNKHANKQTNKQNVLAIGVKHARSCRDCIYVPSASQSESRTRPEPSSRATSRPSRRSRPRSPSRTRVPPESHHITPHHITRHRTTSHHTTPRHTTSHHITSHHTTSHDIAPHHITPHYVTRHRVTSPAPRMRARRRAPRRPQCEGAPRRRPRSPRPPPPPRAPSSRPAPGTPAGALRARRQELLHRDSQPPRDAPIAPPAPPSRHRSLQNCTPQPNVHGAPPRRNVQPHFAHVSRLWWRAAREA